MLYWAVSRGAGALCTGGQKRVDPGPGHVCLLVRIPDSMRVGRRAVYWWEVCVTMDLVNCWTKSSMPACAVCWREGGLKTGGGIFGPGPGQLLHGAVCLLYKQYVAALTVPRSVYRWWCML